MISIPEAVRQIVEAETTLRFGLHNRLLNLTQVSRFIQPLVEARTGRSATRSSILMGLSRLQKQVAASPHTERRVIDRLTVHSNLCSITLPRTPDALASLNRLFSRIRRNEGYVTVTQGVTEVTSIFGNDHFEVARSVVESKPLRVHRRLAGLGVLIERTEVMRSGILYRLLQQIAMQGISVVEVASTMSEFNIYLDETDLVLAMDSIYSRFLMDR